MKTSFSTTTRRLLTGATLTLAMTAFGLAGSLTHTTAAHADGMGWTVSLTADNSSVADGTTVTLTATTNQDVGPTPYYIDIMDQATGQSVGSCGYGTTCSAPVSSASDLSDSYYAIVNDEEDPPTIVAQSAPVPVTWSGSGTASGGTGDGTQVAGGNRPVDLDAYCQSIGYQGVLPGSSASDWMCDDGTGSGPTLAQSNFDAACQSQYGAGWVGQYTVNNTWNCVQGSSGGGSSSTGTGDGTQVAGGNRPLNLDAYCQSQGYQQVDPGSSTTDWMCDDGTGSGLYLVPPNDFDNACTHQYGVGWVSQYTVNNTWNCVPVSGS